MLTRKQKIEIIDAVCDSDDNSCTIECIARAVNKDGFCKKTTEYTDKEIDHALWEIFNACGITYQPERRVFFYNTRIIGDHDDAKKFIDDLTAATAQGFTMENCGVNGTGTDHQLAWAILSKPEKET